MVDKDDVFSPLLGLGIAGNSAGHLEQTGEIDGLITVDDAAKPQALFPFYVASAEEEFLTRMPYSSAQLQLPESSKAKVQMEAELGLKLAVVYNDDGIVTKLTAVSMTVINDATYRNATVYKLAEKKNWGLATTGLAKHEILIEKFEAGGELEHFRLCGFHQSNGQWHLACQDTAISEYTYFYQELLHWLVIQIQQQQDKNALHNIQNLLSQDTFPEHILVSIGATRYSLYGEQHQFHSGDQSAVILYDSRVYHINEIVNLLKQNDPLSVSENTDIIILQQRII